MLIGDAVFVLLTASLAFQVQTLSGPYGVTGLPQNSQQRAPAATDCAASGTVVNALTGQPIARAMVTMGGNGSNGSATDSNGQWSVTNVTCGSFLPSASRPGFINNNQGPQLPAGPRIVQLVSGSPVRDIKISLMPEGSIVGKIQDRNGEPIEGAQVRAMRVQVQNGVRMMANASGGTSDAQGNFRLGSLGTGRYIVCATSNQITYPVGGGAGLVYQEDCYPGPASTGISNAVPLAGGHELRATLTLSELPGVHIRGTVSGAPPMAGPGRGNIQLMRQSNGGGRGAQIAPDGTFDLAGVAPGSYTLRANFPVGPNLGGGRGGQDTAVAQVEVRDSDINGLILAVQPPGAVSGTVRFELSNPQTTPNPSLNVNLNPAPVNGMIMGSFPGQAQWDAAHLGFSFPEVQAGEYRLNTGANGTWVKSMTLRGQDILNTPFAVDGTTGPVEIVLSDQTGDLDLSITDKDGQPAAGGVILKPSHGQTMTMRLGDTGHAMRKGLPVGDYTVWAFDDITMVPWAEDDWMTRYAGPSEKISIVQGNTATLTMKRTAAPTE